MKRLAFLIFILFGLTSAAMGQTVPSDSHATQALLSEVRQLRQDLHASLDKLEVGQILLARLQIQEVAVTRATQHLDDARSKLGEVQVVIKGETAEVKHLEDASPNDNETQAQIDDALGRARADLAASTDLAQQRQALETEAEQQLRIEREKLDRLENQLEELVRAMGNSNEQSRRTPPRHPEAPADGDQRK